MTVDAWTEYTMLRLLGYDHEDVAWVFDDAPED